MIIRGLGLSVFLFSAMISVAQDHSHDHRHEHAHQIFEIGFSNGAVYNVFEKEVAYAAHIHGVLFIGENRRYGFGLGYERIFDEHQHNAINIIFHYRPGNHLVLNLAPGIVWLSSQNKPVKPAMHIEGLYEFDFGRFHLGPILGIGFNPEDFHASLGVHLALGF
ncbi:MAG: hypothetical protein V2I54_09375 [Bacteroidales bacterium]|jgi:hypothetical protein|nr:hypothetical protein [Bacteroidales bacterium]